MNRPEVSIIIPVKKVNNYIKESISHILNLDYKNFEILIFPDEVNKEAFPKTRLIPTGPIGPAEKRDLSLKYAKGEILAFLDDDAYPKSDWLKKAIRNFKNPEVAAVGGPAITPESNNLYQKASAAVFESWLGGGQTRSRYLPIGKMREVDDWPSVNLLVKKDIFQKTGGFDSNFWPGEDTKLCLDIIQKGKKIIYDPGVLVWHHRRPLFIPHLKQVANYALHRGYFVKKFPETSRRLSYFIPSIFIFGLMVGLLLSLISRMFALIFISAIGVYFLILIASGLGAARKAKNLLVGLLALPAIFLTHLFYGLYFLKGLLTPELKR